MYDWANSVYSLVITSSIFPAYYEGVTSGKPIVFLGHTFNQPSALYNYAVAFAFLFVALISPMLSSIADSFGNKKRFMQFFCYLGSLSCCGMYYFTKDNPQFGLILFILASIGYSGSIVFYNAYLPEIAAVEDQDKVSAKGFAYGYVGSVILLLFCLILVMKHDMFGVATSGQASQISFFLTGLWWLGFAQITFFTLPKNESVYVAKEENFLTRRYTELKKVWDAFIHPPSLKRF